MKNQKADKPLLSILIPFYNEQEYIQRCLESILSNTYPSERMEILIMDGMSTDRTREVIGDIQKKYQNNNIRIIDNPGRNKAKALNLGIQNARGEILMRMDAHAVYDERYISECVAALFEYEVDNVGGLRKTLPGTNSLLGKSIAYSLGNRFAVGNSSYRIGGKKPVPTDIVFLFCCRKELFDKVGLFDERLIRGQDREFNLRLTKMGFKMLQIPTAVSYYYSRAQLGKFLHWIFVGGMTPVMISRITGENLFSLRNFIPSIFLLTLFFLGLSGFFLNFAFILFTAILVLYFFVALFFSFPVVKREKNPIYFISMPFIFFLTHIVYGAGFLAGFFKKFEKDPCV